MSICGNVTSSVTRAVTGSVTGSNEGGCSGSKGVVFSGSEAIYAPNTVLTAPPFTMVCWGTADTTNKCLMSLGKNPGTTQGHFLQSSGGDVLAYSRETSFELSKKFHGLPSGTLLHAAGVWASDSSRIVYVNGEAGTEDTDPQAVSGITTFAVGSLKTANVEYEYNGTIYHAAWYNRALSPTEIAELYAGADPRNYSGLVRYLPLAGADTAADELIEPSTWTTVGTLEDGDCETTVTEAYVPTAIDVKIGVSQHSLNASKGVAFSGTQAIYAPNTVLTEPGVDGMTMACWLTVDSGEGVIMAMSNDTIASSPDAHWLMFQFDTVVRAFSYASSFVSSTKSHGASVGDLIHVAGVWDGNSSRIAYVDGIAGPENTETQSPSGINNFSIGELIRTGANLYNYNGQIYHAAWYNRALSPTEIAELAAGADPQDYAGLVRYLPLDGAANAASEVIEPSTWTVEGTLADGAGDTTVTKQTFTNANLGGKTPKGALAFMTNATVADTVTASKNLSLGVTDGVTDYFIHQQSTDDLPASDIINEGTNASFLYKRNDAVPQAVDVDGAFDSFSADSTAVNLTTAPPAAYLSSLVQFAGDDVKAESGKVDHTLASGGSVVVSLSDSTLNADIIIFLFRISASNTFQSIGFASNESGGIGNYSVASYEEGGVTPTNIAAAVSNDKCAAAVSSAGAFSNQYAVTDIQDGQFTITPDNSSSRQIYYLALSFGGAKVKAGTIETPTDASVDWNVTGVGFKPQFVFSVWSLITAVQGYNTVVTSNQAASLALYSFTGSDEAGACISSQDNASTTVATSQSGQSNQIHQGAVTGIYELSNPTMTSDGWTVAAADIVAALGDARQGIYVAVEDVSE